MRTGVIISLILLCATVAVGCWEEHETSMLCRRYESAAEELYTLVQMENWPRAEQIINAYLEDWERTVPWLQALINHEDIDDVTLALVRICACIDAKDASACRENCAELRENARHIHHRDAFTLGNVL